MGSLVAEVTRYQQSAHSGTNVPVCLRLPPEAAQDTWPRLIPFLRRAMKEAHGELTESAIRAYVASERMAVWAVLGSDKTLLGVLLTQVVEYPSSLRSLQIVLMSGARFRSWMSITLDALLAFAQTEHCVRLEAVGRKGLLKLLAPCGFELSYHTVIREVPNGEKRRR